MSKTPLKISREVWVRGATILLRLLKDDLTLARAIKERRYKDLYAAVLVANCRVNPRLSVTDPAQYKALQRAITLFYVKGYRCLDHNRLHQLSEHDAAA